MPRKNFIGTIEKEFGRPFSPIELEQVMEWEKAYPEEIMMEALKITVLRGVYNLVYMDRILQGWERVNLRTIQQVLEHEKRQQQRKEKPGKQKTEWNVKNLEDLYEL